VLTLKKAASRILFGAIVKVAQQHPRPMVDSLLLPLLCPRSGDRYVGGRKLSEEPIGSAECEVISRITKECIPKELLSSFLDAISTSNIKWTELTTGVITGIVNLKPSLDADGVSHLVAALQRNVDSMTSSIKFATLVLNVIAKYGSQLVPHKEVLRENILAKSTVYVAKTALSKLESL